MEEINVVRVPVHFLFTVAHFYLALVAASIFNLSPPLQNFHFVLPTKKCLRFFISRSKSLSPFFSLSFAGLPPTFSFLCLSLTLYSKFVDMTIYLNLILLDNTDTERISAFRFLLFSLLYKAPVAIRFPTKITSSCIWVAIPVERYFTLVCLCCGRTVSRAVGRCTVT